jgi:hypothetical protein
VDRPASYRINTPRIAYQNFDDETVIIDLPSGMYYSVAACAADIWIRVDGATVDEIVEEIASLYAVPRAEAESVVRPFLDELSREGLIVGAEEAAPVVPRPRQANEGRGIPRPRLEPAVLRRYSDMQELLLLDPIHDVDEVGWPTKPEARAS